METFAHHPPVEAQIIRERPHIRTAIPHYACCSPGRTRSIRFMAANSERRGRRHGPYTHGPVRWAKGRMGASIIRRRGSGPFMPLPGPTKGYHFIDACRCTRIAFGSSWSEVATR
jgi:hypothetical protein